MLRLDSSDVRGSSKPIHEAISKPGRPVEPKEWFNAWDKRHGTIVSNFYVRQSGDIFEITEPGQ